MSVRRSALLDAHGFVHGFGTRAIDLAHPADGDGPEVIARWRQAHAALARAIGHDVEHVHEARQVHGADVLVVRAGEAPEQSWEHRADALVTRASGVAVAVRTADCAPILVGDTQSGAVAAIHAGWRGYVAGVIERGVGALVEGGSRVEDLVACIGPHILCSAFEIGDDVAEQIARATPGEDVIVRRAGAKPRADLLRGARAKLAALGVARVDAIAECTLTDRDAYFSHRREGDAPGGRGRHLSLVVARRG